MAYGARFSQDSYPDEERILMVTPEGQRTVLPASARRLAGEALEVYAELMQTALQVNELEAEMTEMAHELRGRGVSWALIGHAVGLTGEGARGRYGEAPEEG